MREIKSINQILSASAIDILNDLLSECDVPIDSIKLCSSRMFVIDSILLHMFGYLEKKLQNYYLYYAMIDPDQRFRYYNFNHSIEFEFKEILNIYRISFKIDKDDKEAPSKLIDFIKLKFVDFKRDIRKTMCNFSIWEDINYLYDSFNSLIFGTTNDEIYKCLKELFEIAYAYRNKIAHNLDFEYKNCTCDFDVLMGRIVNYNLLSYFFIIVIIDYILNECYHEILNSNLLLF